MIDQQERKIKIIQTLNWAKICISESLQNLGNKEIWQDCINQITELLKELSKNQIKP